MNKRLLSRLMHERVSGLQSSSGYFFHSDFEYMLRGVVFNFVPGGVYIYEFRFPLFGSVDFLHLSYSDRLSERAGYIGKGEMSEKEIIDFIMSSPEGRRALAPFDKLTELPDFVHYLESAAGLSRRVLLRLIHIPALLLLGQESRAAGLLDDFGKDAEDLLHEREIAYLNLLRASFRQGSAAVRTLLDQIRLENMQKLGLAP